MAVSVPSGLNLRGLLLLLADGWPRCGARLMRELEASREELDAGILQLRERGIEVRGLTRGGYRLPKPVELLDDRRIRAALRADNERRLRTFDVLFEVDSTNTRLLGLPPPPAGHADACMSELQYAGRGRRGRRWIAPFGDNIALSIGWSLHAAARPDSALSLAAGVAICRALERVGARAIGLKWPNDVWLGDDKIGGVLLEMRAEGGAGMRCVIGVGLNVELSEAARIGIERTGVRAAAVADACPGAVSRNQVAGALLDELLSMLTRFEREGFTPFRAKWIALDALRDRPVRLLAGDGVIAGTARGVDADGALLLESAGRMLRVMSGEVSVRLTEGAV